MVLKKWEGPEWTRLTAVNQMAFGIYAVLEGELGGIAPEIDGHAGKFFNYLINGDFENMDPFRKRSDFKVNIWL